MRSAHKPAGLAVPTDDERVRATARGIRRTIGTARTRKAPATNNRLLAMVALHGRTLSALRDRALLLLGFAGAFRRSELVALDVSDIEETTEGLRGRPRPARRLFWVRERQLEDIRQGQSCRRLQGPAGFNRCSPGARIEDGRHGADRDRKDPQDRPCIGL